MQPLEQQLFSWSGWDGDQELTTFYKPVLKVTIGCHPAGTKFDTAFMLYTKSVLQLVKDGEEGAPQTFSEYALKLSIESVLKENAKEEK